MRGEKRREGKRRQHDNKKHGREKQKKIHKTRCQRGKETKKVLRREKKHEWKS